MQNALVNLREVWIKEGYPPVIARMGINTGPAIIGNMGSQQRMDYTMMGDTVNSASRFEGANKAYGTFTMISEFTCNQVKDKFVVRKLDLLRVVGKTTPTEVYELVGRIGEVSPEKLSIIDEYHSALQEYRGKKWDSAYEMFRDLIKKYNDPPSRTYFERCQKYKKNPPPENWDGIFILSTK
jgi:adenylate cyclase